MSLVNAMVRVLPTWITVLVTAVGLIMVFLVVECAIQGYLVKPNLIFGKLCSPVLTYGLECVYLNKTAINKLESLQGRCIKEAIGVSKRSHHSDLLTAMGINT